jgi:hypothetical protein
MAKAKVQQRQIELEPPLAGVSENLSFENQPPYTTPVEMNMRAYDPDEQKARKGARPANTKAYSTQIGGDFPVVKMRAITNTYIVPE